MIEAVSVKGGFYDISEAKIHAAKLDEKLPAHLNSSAVIFVPVNKSEPFFMQERGLKTLNGYSGNFHDGYSIHDSDQQMCLQTVSRI